MVLFLDLMPAVPESRHGLEQGVHSDQLDTTQSFAHGTTQNSSIDGLLSAWHLDSSTIS